MSHPVISPKKLIEVALPLDAINAAARDEKAVPRRGHPQTLHYWWARRPLAVARAVIFSQLVNDPGFQQGGGFRYGKNKKEAATERRRLFKIIEDLVKWENTTNEEVLDRARAEIRRSWKDVCELNKNHPDAAQLFNPEVMPLLHDPFAGGGAIPLESQRLGLKSLASDLNPVAVFINKALIEIPPKFDGQESISGSEAHPQRTLLGTNLSRLSHGSIGLAADVRHYGKVVEAEARSRLKHLFPDIEICESWAEERPELSALAGTRLPVLAYFWARTVRSPSPAFSDVYVPLVSTFILSGTKENVSYVVPIVDGQEYRFEVRTGEPPSAAKNGTKEGKGAASFRCIISGAPIDAKYIRQEAKAGRLRCRLMALMLQGPQKRMCVSPTTTSEAAAESATPTWQPEDEFFHGALGFRVANYGMTRWGDLYTARQLVILETIGDLIEKVRQQAFEDGIRAGLVHDDIALQDGGTGARAYSEAIGIYLGCALSRLASYLNTICHWNIKGGSVGQIFARQTISMSWDFLEVNPLEKMSGNWLGGVEWVADALERLPLAAPASTARQLDASAEGPIDKTVISTDPPYYDNIGYADLSDFFYVWLRKYVKHLYPSLFATLATPKANELVATPARHGGKAAAENFFLEGMTRAAKRFVEHTHPEPPITIYYAFKQTESNNKGATSSTGWETFLEALHRAGLQLTGTWPVRTEKQGRARANSSNALASSIVLVCRKRPKDAKTISRREFVRELNDALPLALDEMTRGIGSDQSPVAPVDLSQAIIGPGMAIFSQYEAVLEANGDPMSVKMALQLINRFLAEDDFDADTQFCLRWFEQHGWEAGLFGEADVLARAKGTSVEGVKHAGVVSAGGGSVRLYKWRELEADWDPAKDTRIPIWQVLHQLILAYETHGESGAAQLYAATVSKAEAARQLAYRLYTLCERRSWAEDARAYNEVVTGWSGIESAAAKMPAAERQGTLFASEEIR